MSELTKKISVTLGSNFRAKRSSILIDMIVSVYKEKGHVKILDIGGLKDFWAILPQDIFEKYKIEISILRLPAMDREENHGPYKFLYMDACDLSLIENDSFDIAHSNSVIEHVGDWSRMKQFASELKRVSNYHFVQAPNYWFPVEPHGMVLFFHWVPKPLRIIWVKNFKLGFWDKARNTDQAMQIIESARLPNKKMFEALFHESEIVTERFLGLPKSFLALMRP